MKHSKDKIKGKNSSDKKKNGMALEGQVTPVDDSVVEILSIFEPEEENKPFHPSSAQDILYAVCLRVAKSAGIILEKPKIYPHKIYNTDEFLESVSEASQCRIRLMTLTKNWWKEDCGPLIGFKGEGGRAGALIYNNGQYNYFDPVANTSTPVTKEFTEMLSNKAYRFYKTFPDEKLTWRSLVQFVFRDLKPDFIRIFIIQSILGLLALLLPIITGMIFQTIVPNADVSSLKQTIIILIAASFVSSGFGLVQELCVIRISFKSDILMQSALWDRVLRLPLSFLRQYTVGDLANRVEGIDEVQQFITGSMFSTLLHGLFSILSLFLMFYYDVWLALAATGLAFIAVLISFTFNFIQLRYQRPLLEIQGKISGILFQLLSNITKLRVANSEKEAFGFWSKYFTKENKLNFRVHLNGIYFGLFTPLYTILGTVVIFALVVQRGEALSFGHFIAFNAAFGQFFAALLGMAAVVNQGLMIVPVYERAKPILNTLPELESKGIDLEELTGKIKFQNLSFKYQTDGLSILEDISLEIEPGSFVALVGPTGSGKTTLFRILLGFEEVAKSRVFYDDVDLTLLNKRTLRKQLGVVTQSTLIIPGTIFGNITNHSPDLTLADAENVAREMCILDEIMAMPMGMHTWISEGGRNISVGQRQRLLLARAIIRNPRILLLDEATSALDNATQALVHKNLAKLKITKVVAAHRLVTVQNADCIYVIDKGKIIEKGTFLELQNKNGLFSNLINRQLL